MKKLSAIFAIVAIIFAVNTTTFSQPQITVHVTGGYNLPLPDLKGTYPGDLTKNPVPYFMKSGYTAGADVGYYLGKKRNVGITLSLGYNGFSSGDLSDSTGTVFGTTKMNIFTAGLGIQYAFMPKGKANPFIGAEFTGNFFSGKITPVTGTESTLKSASRFGAQINAGVDIAVGKQVGVVIGLRYNLANLIGKDSATSTVANEYTLYDKEVTVGTTTMSARNISYLQFFGGVSFYFNKPKSMKK